MSKRTVRINHGEPWRVGCITYCDDAYTGIATTGAYLFPSKNPKKEAKQILKKIKSDGAVPSDFRKEYFDEWCNLGGAIRNFDDSWDFKVLEDMSFPTKQGAQRWIKDLIHVRIHAGLFFETMNAYRPLPRMPYWSHDGVAWAAWDLDASTLDNMHWVKLFDPSTLKAPIWANEYANALQSLGFLFKPYSTMLNNVAAALGLPKFRTSAGKWMSPDHVLRYWDIRKAGFALNVSKCHDAHFKRWVRGMRVNPWDPYYGLAINYEDHVRRSRASERIHMDAPVSINTHGGGLDKKARIPEGLIKDPHNLKALLKLP